MQERSLVSFPLYHTKKVPGFNPLQHTGYLCVCVCTTCFNIHKFRILIIKMYLRASFILATAIISLITQHRHGVSNCGVKTEPGCTVQPNFMLEKGSMRGFQSNVKIYSTAQNTFVAFIRFSTCLPYVMVLFQQTRICSALAGNPQGKCHLGDLCISGKVLLRLILENIIMFPSLQ